MFLPLYFTFLFLPPPFLLSFPPPFFSHSSPHSHLFFFPVTQGVLLGLLLGTPAMGSLCYHDCDTEENTTPSTTNSQQLLWKGWGLGFLSDPQWDLEGPVLSRCGAGTHSCLDGFLNICCQPQSSESTDRGLPKRKARPIWHSACKGQDLQ